MYYFFLWKVIPISRQAGIQAALLVVATIITSSALWSPFKSQESQSKNQTLPPTGISNLIKKITNRNLHRDIHFHHFHPLQINVTGYSGMLRCVFTSSDSATCFCGSNKTVTRSPPKLPMMWPTEPQKWIVFPTPKFQWFSWKVFRPELWARRLLGISIILVYLLSYCIHTYIYIYMVYTVYTV